MKKDTRQFGFSIITLIFLIALLVVGYIIYQKYNFLAGSQDQKRKQDLVKIQGALEQFYNKNNRYPRSTPQYLMLHGYPVEWGAAWKPYLDTVPHDPDLTLKKRYVYFATEDGQAYWLYASLDNKADEQVCNHGQACLSLSDNNIDSSACYDICNYGVSSSNTSP